MKINYKKLFLDHFDCTLETEWTSGYDFEMSTEYTADSYDVYLCRYAGESIDICENVYYYVHDLEDILMEKIDECDKVYCDEGILDELHIEWEQRCEENGLIEWDDDNQEYVVVGEDDDE